MHKKLCHLWSILILQFHLEKIEISNHQTKQHDISIRALFHQFFFHKQKKLNCQIPILHLLQDLLKSEISILHKFQTDHNDTNIMELCQERLRQVLKISYYQMSILIQEVCQQISEISIHQTKQHDINKQELIQMFIAFFTELINFFFFSNLIILIIIVNQI